MVTIIDEKTVQQKLDKFKKWSTSLPSGRSLARMRSNDGEIVKLCGRQYGSPAAYKAELDAYIALCKRADENGTLQGVSFNYDGTEHDVHIAIPIEAGWSTPNRTGYFKMPAKGVSLHSKRLGSSLEEFGKVFHKETGFHHGNLRGKNFCLNGHGICVIDFETALLATL